jgi:hypothetical protein
MEETTLQTLHRQMLARQGELAQATRRSEEAARVLLASGTRSPVQTIGDHLWQSLGERLSSNRRRCVCQDCLEKKAVRSREERERSRGLFLQAQARLVAATEEATARRDAALNEASGTFFRELESLANGLRERENSELVALVLEAGTLPVVDDSGDESRLPDATSINTPTIATESALDTATTEPQTLTSTLPPLVAAFLGSGHATTLVVGHIPGGGSDA